jgi:hypothetical protein
MSPILILACDTPGLKESLAIAYASPPPRYEEAPVRVPDSMPLGFLVAFVAIIILSKKYSTK